MAHYNPYATAVDVRWCHSGPQLSFEHQPRSISVSPQVGTPNQVD